MQDYHKLLVWQRAHPFAVEVARLAEGFRPGFAGARDQLIDAVQSIVHNIVEGSGAATQLEFARYLDISIKSSSEVEYGLESARDNHLIDLPTFDRFVKELIEIRKMLHGLRKRLLEAAENAAAAAKRRRRVRKRR
jgi:four helix bundle protein